VESEFDRMNVAEKDIKAFRKSQEGLLQKGSRELWQSVEEKSSSANENLARRSQEFFNLPKDSVGAESSGSHLSRRQFFQWGAAATALMGGVACQRRPKDYLVPYVNKPEGYTYGVPVWYASSSPNGLGLLVKTREGRPIKVEGNPDHPGNKGALDARTQASVLELYNPDRLKAPRDNRSNIDIDWAVADAQVKKALAEAAPGEVRVLTEPEKSPTLERLLGRFSHETGAQIHRFSALPVESMSRAYELVTDERRIPYLHFDRADVVVSVNADFLGTWLRPLEFGRQFASRRRLHDGDTNVNRLFCFESMFSTTGVQADHRFSIKPSHEALVLLGLANELSAQLNFDAATARTFAPWTVERVEELTGVKQSALRETAEALAGARGRSLVVAGLHGPQSLEVQLLTIAINQALGNMGQTISDTQEIKEQSEPLVEFEKLMNDCLAGNVKTLIIHGGNPVYSRPGIDFERALRNVPFVVRIATEDDETGKRSHLSLAESHFLESWGDSEAVTGWVAVQQPTIHPLFKTRSFGEVLRAWLGDDPQEDFRVELERSWRELFYDGRREWRDWWRWQLQLGAIERPVSRRAFRFRWTGAAAVLRAFETVQTTGIELAAYESIQMGDGRHANSAWLQELPDPITKVVWTNFAAISPAQAKVSGFRQGDLVNLKLGDRQIELPVFVQPGIPLGVVAAAFGYGRGSAGRLGSERGANIFQFGRRAVSGLLQLSGQTVDVSKVGRRIKLASTQHHFTLHGRDHDILHQTTLDKFLDNPEAAKVGMIDHPQFTMYSEVEHLYAGHRWGMSIDLNKCTGCQACVVACYSENNIPVVGPDQVEMGRHMQWLRLDLYYQGEPEQPEAVFQPMLCQHCERAPCETVCPVLATVHSSDGLNDMVYNRCVGTRYCANNCPFKVRRFNYFPYSESMAGKHAVDEQSPLALMLNPDVTIRSVGVMEKCTFCVQRIRRGVDEIKAQMGSDYRHRIPDGHVQTACQQTCPADAITFGDSNDPNSRVTRKSAQAQGFKVLEVLNTNPQITYLPRVRNKGSEA